MTTKSNAKPHTRRTVTPSLTVRDAAAAIDFYKLAFGAEEIRRMSWPDANKIMFAEIKIGDSTVMLNDEFHERGCMSPQSLSGVASGIYLYVADADSTFKRAIEAGAYELMPPTDMFWGDRFSKIKDPFGQEWSIASHVEDLSEEEALKRQKAFFEQSTGSRG